MRTRLCELPGIEFPIIQAGMSIFTSAELVAAVSNAGDVVRRLVEEARAAIEETKERMGATRPVVRR